MKKEVKWKILFLLEFVLFGLRLIWMRASFSWTVFMRASRRASVWRLIAVLFVRTVALRGRASRVLRRLRTRGRSRLRARAWMVTLWRIMSWGARMWLRFAWWSGTFFRWSASRRRRPLLFARGGSRSRTRARSRWAVGACWRSLSPAWRMWRTASSSGRCSWSTAAPAIVLFHSNCAAAKFGIIKFSNCVSKVFSSLKFNNSFKFSRSARVDICKKNISGFSELVFQILPTHISWQTFDDNSIITSSTWIRSSTTTRVFNCNSRTI